MATNLSKTISGVLSAAVCLGLTVPARAFWTDDGRGGGAEQLGISESANGGEIPGAGVPVNPVEWVSIGGGKFIMGNDDPHIEFRNAKPAHEVDIKAFYMSRTLVTVEQYAECVGEGRCTEPAAGGDCNWRKVGRWNHPVNCVSRDQADQFARFKGGRLPSEAEWEYAARSGGRNQLYPWGNEAATCARAVMHGDNYGGCDTGGTMPVCSKPGGNTAQGLCDMAGNVWQMTRDKYQDSYAGAPADGGAFESADPGCTVLRGGSFGSDVPRYLRADYRSNDSLGGRIELTGFRLAR